MLKTIAIILIFLLLFAALVDFVVKMFGEDIEEKQKQKKIDLMKNAGWRMDDYCVFHRGKETVSYQMIINLSVADVKNMYCK